MPGEHDIENGNAANDYDDSEEDEDVLLELKEGDTPTVYAQLLFFNGFYQCYFHDMFNVLLKNDPVFGVGHMDIVLVGCQSFATWRIVS